MEKMNRRVEKNENRSRENMKAENARISAARLYLHYISIHIQSAMQYKTSFFFDDTWPVFVFV